MVKLRYAGSLILVTTALAACAARTAAPPSAPSASPQALAAKPIEWAKREPTALVWPAQVRHVQVIITHGWTRDERFVWLIANGTEVVSVFDTTAEDVAAVVDASLNAYRAVVSNPTSSLSFGVVGSVYSPPPPHPQVGLPKAFVQHVLGIAWNLDEAAKRSEATAGE